MIALYAIHGKNDLDYPPGYVVLTEGIGHSPNDKGGADYSELRQMPIVRLNNGYGKAGTIPNEAWYGSFSARVANFVAASKNCSRWIIGNEPNHSQERPDGKPILPGQYAQCYSMCRNAIHALPDHEQDEVLLAAIAPYNNQTTYQDNESGDWVQYFRDVQSYLPAHIDGFALHAYARAQTPAAVTSEDRMGKPGEAFNQYHNGFRCYRDWMNAIAPAHRGKPVYITEFNAGGAWTDVDTEFVVEAYLEIADWNDSHSDRPISCLALYRWQTDKWIIKDKPAVIADFMHAVELHLTQPPVTEPEQPTEPDEETERDTRLALLEVQVAQTEARIRQLEATAASLADRIEFAGRALLGEQ